MGWFLTGQNSEGAADDDDELKFIGMIVGSVVGGLLCVIVLAVVIVLCLCRYISRCILSLLTLSPPIPLRLYTLSYWSNPAFLIFDIRALWRSGLSARAPECQKLKMVF